VLVDSTKNPKPVGMVEVTPVIVMLALLAKLPLLIVTVVPLGTKLVEAALILKTADCPVVPCGLVLGKCCSLCIISKPPTSSIRSIILSLIAAVVAIVVSLSGNVSPSLIVSPELMLKYLASDSVSVKYLPSRAPLVSSVSVKYLLSKVPLLSSVSVKYLPSKVPVAISELVILSDCNNVFISLAV